MRDPLHPVDAFQRSAAQLVFVHADEPLLGRPEDDRLFAAPAVGVAVGHGATAQQGAGLADLVVHRVVGVEDEPTGEEGHVPSEAAVVVHRSVDVESVAQADLVVLLAVARGRVHTARALLQSDVVPEEQHRVAVDERVPARQALELLRVDAAHDLEVIDADVVHGDVQQALGQNQHLGPQRLRQLGAHGHVV